MYGYCVCTGEKHGASTKTAAHLKQGLTQVLFGINLSGEIRCKVNKEVGEVPYGTSKKGIATSSTRSHLDMPRSVK